MKNNLKYLLLYIVIILLQLNSFGQNMDSLKLAFRNAKHDTVKIKILSDLSDICELEDVLKYAKPCVAICEKGLANPNSTVSKNFYLKCLAKGINNLGYYADQMGSPHQAIEYYQRSLKIEEDLNDTNNIAITLNNMGIIYYFQGDTKRALDYYLRSLVIKESVAEKYQDKVGIANCLCNIGNIYRLFNDFPKAMEYYSKSLKMYQKLEDKNGISVNLNNIGSIYESQNELAKALDYFYKTLKIREEMKNKKAISLSLNNIGFVYQKQGDLEKSLEFFFKSLAIREESHDKKGTGATLSNIAGVLIKKGEYEKAKDFALRGIKLSKEVGAADNIRSAASRLKLIYQQQNKFKEAFEMYQLEIQMRDSINNQEIQKESIQKEMEYTYEKQSLEIKAEQDKKDVIANEEKQKQKIVTYAISIGFMIVLVLGLFILRGYRQKQKANLIISLQKAEVENQKHLIEEKHKEITDSIRYAKRIQTALMSNEKYIDRTINRLNKS